MASKSTPNLFSDLPVEMYLWVLASTFGFTRTAAGAITPKLAGDLVEIAEFLLALDVERVNALLEGVDDFIAGLADAGERAMGRIAACLDHAEKLAAGHDVEASTVGGEQAEHGEIRICLHRVGHLVVDPGQGGVETGEVVDDCPG